MEADRRKGRVSWIMDKSGVSRDEENYKFLLLEDHGYLPAVIEEPIQDLLWAGAALRALGKGFSLKNYRS